MKPPLRFFCILTSFSLTSAYYLPETSEFVYRYSINVKTGLNMDDFTASEISFSAMISMRNVDNVTIFSFRDSEDFPKGSESIKRPFVVQYNEKGLVTGILAEEEDQVWSLNLKRGIASVFQVDLKNKDSYYVNQQNHNIGQCSVINTRFVNERDGKQVLENLIDHSSCHGTDLPIGQRNKEIDCLDVKSTKRYNLVEDPSNGNRFIHEFSGYNLISQKNAESPQNHYVQVLQMLEYRSFRNRNESEIENDRNIIKSMKHQQLETDFPTKFENDYDIIGGRSKYDQRVLIDSAKVKIETFVSHTKTDPQILISSATVKMGDFLSLIIQQLRRLDTNNLKTLMGQLSQNANLFFLRVLPHIGTTSSTILIRNIVRDGELAEHDKKLLLADFPFYVRHPNPNLIAEMVQLTSQAMQHNNTLKDVAELSVAILLSKVLEKFPDNTQMQTMVNGYIEKLKSTNNYADGVIYMSALQNIKSRNVIDTLEEIIKKPDPKISTHLRCLAMLAAKSFHVKNQKIANELYIPILKNHTEPTEVKLLALNILMTDPTVESLILSYTAMEGTLEYIETYKDYYWSLLKGIAESKLLTKDETVRKYAKKLRKDGRYEKLPTFKSNFDHVLDYYSKEHNLGEGLKISSGGNLMNDNFTFIMVETNARIFDTDLDKDAYYLYIHWKTGTVPPKKNKNFDLTHLPSIKDLIEIDIIKMKNNLVVSVETSKSLDEIMDRLVEPYPMYYVKQDLYKEVLVPTDAGIPVVFYMEKPSVKIGWNQLKYFSYGLKVYDPIKDIWYNVNRNHVTDVRLPMKLKWNKMGSNSFGLRITNDCEHCLSNNTYGFNSFVTNKLITSEDEVTDFKKEKRDTREKSNYSKEFTVWKNHCDHNDVAYMLKFINCNRDITRSDISKLRNSFLSDETKYWDKFPFVKSLLSFKHFMLYASTMPSPGIDNCGLVLIGEGNYTHLDMQLSMTTDDDRSFYKFDSNNEIWKNNHMKKKWSTDYELKLLEETVSLNVSFDTEVEEGRKLYCLEWKSNSISGFDLNVFQGLDGCENRTESKFLLISTDLQLSPLQKDSDELAHAYKSCMEHKQTFDCAKMVLYPNRYIVKVEPENFYAKHSRLWRRIGDVFRTIYAENFVRDNYDGVNKTEIIMDLLPPSRSMDIHFKTPSGSYSYENMLKGNTIWAKLLRPTATDYESVIISECLLSFNDLISTAQNSEINSTSENCESYDIAKCSKDVLSQIKDYFINEDNTEKIILGNSNVIQQFYTRLNITKDNLRFDEDAYNLASDYYFAAKDINPGHRSLIHLNKMNAVLHLKDNCAKMYKMKLKKYV